MIMLICFLVAFLSTTAGAMAGLGGGVIIKPVLDAVGYYDISTVGVLSSITVFSMAIVSFIRQLQYKFQVNYPRTITLGIGSIVGGIVGQSLFTQIVQLINNDSLVKVIQSSVLATLMVFVLLYMNFKERLKQFNIQNLIATFLVGFTLGTLSAFLGIGGGPINVAFLAIFFGMEAKEAAVNSIIIILFSQFSKLTTLVLSGTLLSYDLSALIVMIPAGIMGGLLGSKLNKISSNKAIIRLFNAVTVFVILVNVFNIVNP